MSLATYRSDYAIPGSTLAHGTGSVTVEFDVPARMRDGTTLRANIYRPHGSGPWPTLLMRTPYDKNRQVMDVWCGLDPVQAARQGFLVVTQDVRGRFTSDGDWQPFRYERQDGFDTAEWAAALPGSNGRVGMYSGSYCGNIQWQAAADRPPGLAAISPALTWSEPLEGLLARGGAVELGLALRWALENSVDCLDRAEGDPAEHRRRLDAVAHEWDRLPDLGYWELPVSDVAVLRRHGVPALGGLRDIDNAEAAAWSRITDLYDEVAIPSLHTAGWYDIFLQGTLDNYTAMAARGREANLVVGPWTHHAFGDPVGQQSFGMRAMRNGFPVHRHGDWNDLQLAWFRRHLTTEPAGGELDAPVRIFVMGRNEWRDEAQWPPARAIAQRWYLHAGGTLTPERPQMREDVTGFQYDPTHPVPTVGGHGVLWPGSPSGPMDQAAVEARDDVLVFTSPRLSHDLDVTGRVRVVLYASSSAPSTDWVARLCDVHPDGRSINLCDGIVRVTTVSRGVDRYEIDLWSTSNVFLRGHRLRVHITSSSFPRWDRNLNTGDQDAVHSHVARQRVHHDAEHPSHIEIPVIT
ncbi:CocE/NonD family hydrolase [Saccharomonospora sp. NPDC046836]|uniref:CocE/NonD family hydrolase n=1 Tax=Saccharomonospora sp. NPDC046836 TaxID=3156921 RepID=UPI0033E6E89E